MAAKPPSSKTLLLRDVGILQFGLGLQKFISAKPDRQNNFQGMNFCIAGLRASAGQCRVEILRLVTRQCCHPGNTIAAKMITNTAFKSSCFGRINFVIISKADLIT